jgi:hypothetical protein
MALRNKSLFLYGYEVTTSNNSIDFIGEPSGPTLLASIPVGSYTLTDFMTQIKQALQAADPLRTYTVTAVRTYSGGLQNRIMISSNGSLFQLLFQTGPRVSSSASTLMGFSSLDYTGSLSYTSVVTTGIALVPDYVGYSYLGPDFMHNVYGALNVSASGLKEAIVWQVQKFFQAEFRYEPEAKVITEWTPLFDWMIQQKPFEFTPDITQPTVFYPCTLETSEADGKGLGFTMKEMLPDFPFLYRTGMLKFRYKLR